MALPSLEEPEALGTSRVPSAYNLRILPFTFAALHIAVSVVMFYAFIPRFHDPKCSFCSQISALDSNTDIAHEIALHLEKLS